MSHVVLLEKSKWTKREIWLALDRQTREIIRVFVGDRSRENTKKLGNTLPPRLMGCCFTPTDKWKAYSGFCKHHRIVNKGSGETHQLERFNNTLRQRVSKLARKTLF